MTKHMIGTRKEWLAARLELLEAEKELTRRTDEIARRRQALTWVRIDKEYRFETGAGSASLADLFLRTLATPWQKSGTQPGTQSVVINGWIRSSRVR